MGALMSSALSSIRRSLVNLNHSSTRCIHATASLASSIDPRDMRLDVPRAVDLNDRKKNVEDKYENRLTPVEFLKHREAMKKRFPEGWNPPRKLSREAMDGLRALHQHDPKKFPTPVLAERFQISPEAVRRILKSKWLPNKEEKAKLLEKERRRKQEYIAKCIERERADKLEQFDSHQQPEEPKREKKDGLTLV